MSPLRYDDDSRFTAPSSGLYSFATARNSDPATAKDAAKSMTEPILNRQRLQVLTALYVSGEATAHAIAYWTGFKIQQNVASRRLADLVEMELAEATGKTRPGSSARPCMVYRITDAGREALR